MKVYVLVPLLFALISTGSAAAPPIEEPRHVEEAPESEPPLQVPARPDLSDASSNVPMLNLDALVALQPSAPGSGGLSERESESVQRCDPALDMKFYNNLETYLCMTSPIASCPEGLATQARRLGLEAGIFLAGAVAGGLYQALPLIQEFKERHSAIAGPRSEAIAKAKSDLAPFLDDPHVTANPKLKAALIKALNASNDRMTGKLLSKLLKYDGGDLVSNEVKAAIAMMPKSTTGKLLLQMAGGALLASAIEKMSVVGGVVPQLATPGCDDEGGQYTAEDRYDQCRKKFVIDDHVVAFLALDPIRRRQILNEEPSVCEYYQQFNETLKAWIQPSRTISNLTCSAEGPSYSIGAGKEKYRLSLRVNSSGDPQSAQVIREPAATSTSENIGAFGVQFASDGKQQVIKKISFQANETAKSTNKLTRWNYDQLTNSRSSISALWDSVSGNYVQNNWRPEILSVLTANKLYGSMATMCCQMSDASLQQQCTAMIEHPTAKSVKEQMADTAAIKSQATKPAVGAK